MSTNAAAPLPTDRPRLLARLADTPRCDVIVVGGGATGLGVALDAALRGLSVVLLESHDFAKGTSSRATKLVHGGVRYLAQGRLGLVRQALRERAAVLRNAPHLAAPLPFVVPAYRYWEIPFYGAGLLLYDALGGRHAPGATRIMGPRATAGSLPGLRQLHLRGGVRYWDAQFDDARLALALARSAAAEGALLVNHCPVDGLIHEQGRVAGVRCHDAETGVPFRLGADCVINAAGVWADRFRTMDAGVSGSVAQPMVAASRGVHVVVDRHFMPADHALLIPRTRDGRVLFAIPWLGKLILGTTDTPSADAPREPRAGADDVAFILEEAARYLRHAPTRADVKSVWAGLRPLLRPAGQAGRTSAISREHAVEVGPGGLVTVAGGKWTTYRAMAQDVLARCVQAGMLADRAPCRTARHPLVGARDQEGVQARLTQAPGTAAYGSEQRWLAALPGGDAMLAPGLSEAMVRFAARYEYARTVEDMLARRSRLLFLDAGLAAAVAPAVARVLGEETGADTGLGDFLALAALYAHVP